MTAPTRTQSELTLARDGGPPARTRPEPPMFPGGMELGEEELEAVARVIESKNLFRYYGVGEGPDEVALLRARVRRAHGREARALRQRRLVGAHLRADRRGGRARATR